MEIPGTGGEAGDTVMLYGPLDKQPEMTGWRQGPGPWTPVLEGDKLFGRGGADDVYAIFASLTALGVLARERVPHARCVVLIEAYEESGRPGGRLEVAIRNRSFLLIRLLKETNTQRPP